MVTQHDSPTGRWEMATRRPCAAVRGAVRDLWGFEERTPAPHRRRELPVAGVGA